MKPTITITALGLALTLSACGSDDADNTPTNTANDPALTELDVSVCDPANTTFTLDITNQYFPLPVGKRLVLEGDDEGELVRLELDVLDQTEIVAGVTTRVVTETEFKDGELFERTFNYFAQNTAGDVCYFGEDVEFFENGVLVSTDGTWRAEGPNRPGILMPAMPTPSTQFFQEVAPGIAEDRSAIDAVGLMVSTPAGDFTDGIGALDWNQLENETIDDAEAKFFVPGIGLVKDEALALIEFN